MDLWPKDRGLLPAYSRYGTVPGRSLTHNYPYRHQAIHYPPTNHEDHRVHVRGSSYWTLPRSGTAAAVLDYTNWTEPQLPSSTAAQLPYILDCHSQQDLGNYEPSGVRKCATGDYERGYTKEGWQRRWEAFKSNSGSHGEMEAWAARYSHSLPRRRHLEVELRGTFQGLLESRRTGIDPCVAGQCANINNVPGQWESAAPEDPSISHLVDVEGQIELQRRRFSQPPGYIAPPPYNSPHKGSSMLPHCDFERTHEKPDRDRKNDLERIPDQRSAVHKVIEGRKFRLRKKTGGMTIFCLVSRTAGPTEPSSSTPQANIELENCSRLSSDNNQTSKVADEVDKARTNMSALTKPKQMTPNCRKSITPEEKLPKKDKMDDSTFKKQSTPSVPVRYPLWREPSFTKRTLKDTENPLGMGVRRLDIKKGPESEEDLLVIDTTCVVVKMEMIQSPKKEHVHLLGSTDPLLHPDPNTELNHLPKNGSLKEKLCQDLEKEGTLEMDSENPARESLEKRAERILGLRLDASSCPDGCRKNGLISSQVNNNVMKGKLPIETTVKEEQSENQTMSDDWVQEVSCGNLLGSQPNMEADTDSQHETDQVETSQDAPVGYTQEGDNSEQRWEEYQFDENGSCQIVTPLPVPINPSLPPLSPDDGESNPNLIYSIDSLPSISESETEEGLDAECGTLDLVVDDILQHETGSLQPSRIPLADPSVVASKSNRDASEEVEERQTSHHEEALQESPTDGTGEQPFEADRVQAVSDFSKDFVGQMPEISMKAPTDLNIQQQEHLCAQAENENKPEDEDLERISPENSLSERVIKSFEVKAEENLNVKETNKELPEDNKDMTDLDEQTVEYPSDKQDTEALFKLQSPPSPSDSNGEAQSGARPPLLGSREGLSPPAETGSTENPTENIFAPLLLPDFIPSSESFPLLSPFQSSDCTSADQPQGEELHYPNSLWDAVNRIRKHTAPDSENEEEEVAEFWDPESAEGELDIFEELEVSEDTGVGQMLRHPWREEDTLSSCSTGSHDSGDTVIVADEEEVEQTEECWRGCLDEVKSHL
ncbi:uncharacterized protein [Nerophis lumbriciformis]|uniref:uncharacterized protein n=1 Tax=Nerophis lumbriciformis TaxID=546530 RepID=UPI002ADFE00D|nr:uncharacterized protein si:ch211-159e12.5 [Nerophis lumbriciformis]